jgi:periplasmic divalent cation tolerance protein
VTDCIVCLVTVASRDEGERLAATVVTEQLAACVNVLGPMRSIFRWEGEVRHDDEFLLIIKTRAELFARLAARVQALHSYQTPEVVALPLTAGTEAYLDWLRAATVPKPV